MASSRIITDLSSLFMLSSDSLGSELLNKKFRQLLENDKIINDSFVNNIGIWQCNWYYNSSIRGYSTEDIVWLNTEEPMSFVKRHAKTIKLYTDLNPQILEKLPEFDEGDDDVIMEYYSAMSGYTNPNLGKNVVLPPIYDIGDYSKPIQVAISLRDNNKALLSDKSAWRKIFVNSDEDETEIRETIDRIETEKVKIHLSEYHMVEENPVEIKARLSNYLDMPSEIYSYDSVPERWYSKYNEENVSGNFGVDYVMFTIKKPLLLSGTACQFQCARYWKSGLLEHYGTIATASPMFLSAKYLTIPFNWKFTGDGSGARAFEKGEIGNAISEIIMVDETPGHVIDPDDDMINVVQETDPKVLGSNRAKPFADGNYNVSIHPVWQNLSGIDDNYLPVNYGSGGTAQNWNTNYLTNEILRERNRNFVRFRYDSRTIAPFISYYAVGRGDF